MSKKVGSPARKSQGRAFWPSRILECMLALAAWLPLTVFAHHSFAMYDQSKLLTVKGTIVEWNWANPHISLTIVVPGTSGEARWVLAGQSVSTWSRIGMHGKDLKAGDKVSLQFNPAKDGSNTGYIRNISLPNGQTFGEAPTTAAPSSGSDSFANPLEAPPK